MKEQNTTELLQLLFNTAFFAHPESLRNLQEINPNLDQCAKS